MTYRVKEMKEIDFQLCSVPDSEGLVLEFLDENEEPFMEISVDSNDCKHLVIFKNKNNISIPLEKIYKGLEIAEREVVNIDSYK
ncbi:MAG: hypothetical protein ABJI60_12435 [Kangiellaceae bacterium]